MIGATFRCYFFHGHDILLFMFFFFQAEDGIRDLVRSRGLGDVYKRQLICYSCPSTITRTFLLHHGYCRRTYASQLRLSMRCLLYTSDAADERSSVDLGGRRIIKKKNTHTIDMQTLSKNNYRQALTELKTTQNR